MLKHDYSFVSSINYKVTIRYDYVFQNTSLTSGTNDQAGQDAFNSEKEKANQTRTDIYNSLKTVNWGEFQASSGLELKDKNVDNFNLGEVEAYCSADGAVVRKCEKADSQCTKTTGTITKCSKFYSENGKRTLRVELSVIFLNSFLVLVQLR